MSRAQSLGKTPRQYLGDVIYAMFCVSSAPDDASVAARGGGGDGEAGDGGGGGGESTVLSRSPGPAPRALLIDGGDAVPLIGRLDLLEGGGLPAQMMPEGGGRAPLARARRSVSRIVSAMRFWR